MRELLTRVVVQASRADDTPEIVLEWSYHYEDVEVAHSVTGISVTAPRLETRCRIETITCRSRADFNRKLQVYESMFRDSGS